MIEAMECTAAAPVVAYEPETVVVAEEQSSSSRFALVRCGVGAGPQQGGVSAGARRTPQLHDLLERETKRMAQSLHDEAGQLLALVYLKLDELTGRVPTAQLGSVGELRTMVAELESELRRLSHELRPMILDDFGLLPAVEFLGQGVSRRTGMAIAVEGNLRGRMATAVETTLYRIVYEALRLACQSGARRVQISFLRHELRVECSIRLEGGNHAGLEGALTAIRQRVEDLSGSLLSCTTPRGNMAIVIGIPVD
jgi:signal transduction histidine kinase